MRTSLRASALSLLLLFLAAPQAAHAATIDLNWQIGTHHGITTIEVGDTVRWTWTDSFAHTVTSTGNFDSGALTGNGTQYSFTFNSVGMFDYFCGVHGVQNMSGTIEVEQPVTTDSSSWGKVKALYR